MNVPIQSIFRYDSTNAGDYFSPPFRYVNLGSSRFEDISHLNNVASLAPNLVIGGGGLLGSRTFDPHFKRIFERRYQTVVGWGLGDNARINPVSGYVKKSKCNYPSYIDRFDLLGVRDYGTNYPWVPCASCLHPLFQKHWQAENEIVVYEHKRVPISIDCFPKMSNGTNDLAKILRFIGSARVVVTNSYHGAYWGQLFGKAVLVFPFGSKFYHFKHKITLCKPADWKKGLDRVEEQPPALAECIEANLGFWQLVHKLFALPPSYLTHKSKIKLQG